MNFRRDLFSTLPLNLAVLLIAASIAVHLWKHMP
jgi:hypothetical protein